MSRILGCLGILLFTTELLIGADFVDFRAIKRYLDPFTFEVYMDQSAVYPNSLTILKKEQPLLWAANSVKDFDVSYGNVAVLSFDGTVYIGGDSDNSQIKDSISCTSLVVDQSAETIQLDGDFLSVFNNKTVELFYLPYCAKFAEHSLKGYSYTVNNRYICEADNSNIYVRDIISGQLLLESETVSTVLSVNSVENGCYFIFQDGGFAYYNSETQTADLISIVGGAVAGVVPSKYGFTGVYKTEETNGGKPYFQKFDLSLYSVGATPYYELNYSDLNNSGNCILVKGDSNFLCFSDYHDELKEKLENAEKSAINSNDLYLLNSNKLSVYSTESSWVKNVDITYSLPLPCSDGDDIYFTDFSDNLLKVSPYQNEPVIVNDFPVNGCRYGDHKFINGAIYDKNMRLIYTYALPIKQFGDMLLYRRTQADGVYYFYLKD